MSNGEIEIAAVQVLCCLIISSADVCQEVKSEGREGLDVVAVESRVEEDIDNLTSICTRSENNVVLE